MSSSKTDTTHRFFQDALEIGTDDLVKQLGVLIFDFANNNNIAARAITDHTNCPEFKTLIEFAMKHGSQLQKARQVLLGRQAFSRIRMDRFSTFLAAVEGYVIETRDYWEKYCRQKIPFVIVAHDIWDSRKNEVMGISVHFYNPSRRKFIIAQFVGVLHPIATIGIILWNSHRRYAFGNGYQSIHCHVGYESIGGAEANNPKVL